MTPDDMVVIQAQGFAPRAADAADAPPQRQRRAQVTTGPDNPTMILDSVAMGVFSVNLERRITLFNRAAEEMTGIPAEKAIGQPCREVFKSSLCDSACPVLRAMETGRQQFNVDAVFIRQGGRSILPVNVSASPVLDELGNLKGAVEIFQSHQLAKILSEASTTHYDWGDFIGSSAEVTKMFEVLKVVAPTDVTILVEGPTGTGKDLLSRIIHNRSPRAKRPFIKVNCAALPENLLESELFGFRKGAFTGAHRDKPGRFQMAEGGTIFLDEISEMPLALQAKLLRVIEDREFYALGDRQTTKVDVRIIAATNKPLHEQVRRSQFREDLFYRLNVIRVFIPPLKERREDIPLLINRIIQRKNVERGTFICRFSAPALNRLLKHPYPGNVREMENILEHACLLCGGDVIQEDHLPPNMDAGSAPTGPVDRPDEDESEKLRLVRALTRHDWNRSRTANALGMDRTTLWRKMKRYNIQTP